MMPMFPCRSRFSAKVWFVPLLAAIGSVLVTWLQVHGGLDAVHGQNAEPNCLCLALDPILRDLSAIVGIEQDSVLHADQMIAGDLSAG
ncbi:MAG: hypothetical protein U0231_12945 [Nitrospiraceae bacterium]